MGVANAVKARANCVRRQVGAIMVKDKQIHMVDYDGANDTVIYAGPFMQDYAFPWPDATKLVVLTNLNNSTILPNLYTISLK